MLTQSPGSVPNAQLRMWSIAADPAEAALDAQIPQTAKVKRGEVKVEVVYDGDPKFVAIPGTELQYAENTGEQVLKEGARYYVCDAGVWYVSESPMGPWQVAEERPEGVDDIPPAKSDGMVT